VCVRSEEKRVVVPGECPSLILCQRAGDWNLLSFVHEAEHRPGYTNVSCWLIKLQRVLHIYAPRSLPSANRALWLFVSTRPCPRVCAQCSDCGTSAPASQALRPAAVWNKTTAGGGSTKGNSDVHDRR